MLKSIALLICLFFSLQTFAEGEPWQIISNVHFSKDKMGFAFDHGDFIQDRKPTEFYEKETKSEKIIKLSKEEFLKRFSLANKDIVDPRLSWGTISSQIDVKNGEKTEKITFKGNKCKQDPEADIVVLICEDHLISRESKSFKIPRIDTCKYGCDMVEAKIIDNNLWIALGTSGELEWYGSGMLAFDANNNLLFNYSESRMGGLLFNDFVKNPETFEVFATSNDGIRIFDPRNKKVKKVMKTYLDFDSTGQVSRYLSADPKVDNVFAYMSSELGFGNDKNFYDKAKPLFVKNFTDKRDLFENSGEELKSLAPFIISALKSNDQIVRQNSIIWAKAVKAKEVAMAIYNYIMTQPESFFANDNVELYDVLKTIKFFRNEKLYSQDELNKMKAHLQKQKNRFEGFLNN